jgi:hypothetical protein
MRYQLLLCADHAERSGAEERTAVPAGQPLAGGPAGTAGLQWLWGMVELRLGRAEPDTAA